MSSNFAIIDADFGLCVQIMCGSIHCDEFNEGKIKKYYSYTHAMEDGWIRTKWIKFCPPGKNYVWVCPSCSKKYKWENSKEEIDGITKKTFTQSAILNDKWKQIVRI